MANILNFLMGLAFLVLGYWKISMFSMNLATGIIFLIMAGVSFYSFLKKDL